MRPVSLFSLAAALGVIALLPACAGNSAAGAVARPKQRSILAGIAPLEKTR